MKRFLIFPFCFRAFRRHSLTARPACAHQLTSQRFVDRRVYSRLQWLQ